MPPTPWYQRVGSYFAATISTPDAAQPEINIILRIASYDAANDVPTIVIPRSGSIGANVANVFEDYEGSVDTCIITATGIGTSLYTEVGDALSAYFGKTIVPTEGDQVTVQDITPYLGIKVPKPEPTPIPVEGDVQIFADAACTEYATGVVSKIYARINVPWSGMDSGWAVLGESDGDKFVANGPTNVDNTYSVNVWVDFQSADSNVPFTAGAVIECTYGSDPFDVTGYTTIFSKP